MKSCPGIGIAAAEWLAKQDPMLVGADNWPVEVSPNPDPQLSLPVHQIMLVVNGIHLLENLKLDELAAKQRLRVRLRHAAAQDAGRHRLDGRAGRDPLAGGLPRPLPSSGSGRGRLSSAGLMTDTLPTKRWTRLEYDRLIQTGAFGPEDRIELLGGALVVREPQDSPHAMGIRMAEEALRRAFATGWDVRVQLPVALDEESEPEPDVSVVPGSCRDYPRDHPGRAVLIVEIAT